MSNFKMTSHKDEVLDELDSKVEIALEKIGLRAETHAKKYCPVDTGRFIRKAEILNISVLM